jgi:hypothetical protein
MSNSTKIDYDVVFDKTAQLRSNVEGNINESNQGYNQLLASLDNLDGATNASVKTAMELEREKAQVTAEIAYNLLSFIDAAARRFQGREQAMASLFMGETSDVNTQGGD